VAPALAFLGGVGCIILGGFVGILPVVAIGFFSLLASVALFVIAPLVALTSSNRGARRDERSW
jgi:UDP-N-acetylmuramyl pentapeptide phosphotransferase/UDP-N-acetylglucosamine-1-phosphate transferase